MTTMVPPSLIASSLGGLVFIDEFTISGTPSSLDITTGFTDVHDAYCLQLFDLRPSTDDVGLGLRISYSSSFFTSSYRDAYSETSDMFSLTWANNANLCCSNVAGEGWSGQVHLLNARRSGFQAISVIGGYGEGGTGTKMRPSTGGGGYNGSQGIIDAIQFRASSGTLAGGTIRMFGIANS